MSGVSIIDTVYRLSQPSERAEFDRKVEDWGAKCYQATVEFVDPPRVLTEAMLRHYYLPSAEEVFFFGGACEIFSGPEGVGALSF